MDDHKRECECEACKSERSLVLIKEAHKFPKAFTHQEIVDFLNTPRYLGRPQRQPKPVRGKQSKKTQYDVHSDRWKGKYHTHIRFTQSGNKGNEKKGRQTVNLVKKALSEAPQWLIDCEPHRINKWIRDWLKQNNLSPRHRATIYRALCKIASNRDATKYINKS